jgi:hypothetical protein
MKHLHRLIVTSGTYRLQSFVADENHPSEVTDAENAWYWRANPRRLEAEAVRDSLLACSGSLDESIGGPEIDHALGLSVPRRSLYFASHGESQMEFLSLFDGPNVNDCYERTESILPTQSLAMVNSELAQTQSKALADRLTSFNTEPTATVVFAFEQILTRPPTAQEQHAALAFLERQTHLFTRNSPSDSAESPAQRAYQSLIRALFSHNDFVTIR